MSLRSFRVALVVAAITFPTGARCEEAADISRDVPPYPSLPFPPGAADPETLCGDKPTFQDVEKYDGTLGVPSKYAADFGDSTAQLRWLPEDEIEARLPDHAPGNVGGRKWCTGTLVSKNRILTAAHCVQVQKDFGGGWVTPHKTSNNGPVFAQPEVLATLQSVNFKYQVNAATGAERNPDIYPVVKLIEFGFGKPQNLDYALIEVGPNSSGKLPGDSYKIGAVTIRKPVIGETTAIFQHPNGMPKKVEAGTIGDVSGSKVYYKDVDTLGGTSGSGIRDKDGNLIGVHTNGGCPFKGNAGVTLEAIKGASSAF